MRDVKYYCWAALLGMAGMSGPGVTARAETVRDRLWIWGHPAGVYNATYLRPMKLVSTIEPVDAAEQMGLGNMIFVRDGGKPAPPFDDYYKPFGRLDRVYWSLVAAGGGTSQPERDAAFALADKNKNVVGFILDDFFHEPAAGNAADPLPSPRLWLAANQPEFPVTLTVTAPQPVRAEAVELAQTGWHTGDYRAKGIKVELCADGKTWKEAGGGTLPDEPGAVLRLAVPAAPFAALRVRFLDSHDREGAFSVGLAGLRLLAAGRPVDLSGWKAEASSTYPGFDPAALLAGADAPEPPFRASLSPEELRAIRQRQVGGRRLPLMAVVYTRQVKPRAKAHVAEVDELCLWTWRPEDLRNLETNLGALEKLAPGKPVYLGCYMYDFHESKPLPVALMKEQVDLGFEWLKAGRIRGMIFLATPNCDVGLEAVDWTRQWIRAVGARELSAPAEKPAPGARTRSGAGGWRVGLARAKITPDGPAPLVGYGPRVSDGVLDDLEAKALALEHGDGGRAVLLTADLCFFRAPTAEALVRQIMDKTGLARQQILLNASHTHSGPVIGLEGEDQSDLSDQQRQRVRAYTEQLVRQLADLAAAALADLRPASLAWGTGQAGDFVVNRRVKTERGVGMAPNPQGPVDRDVPVLRVDGPDGRLRAVVFGCACHPVTLDGSSRKVSGDYAGFAQKAVEKRHPGAQAMFVAGCGGDANTHPRGGPHEAEWTRRHGERLAAEVCRVAEGPLALLAGPLRAEAAPLELPLNHSFTREDLQKIASGGQTVWHQRNARALLETLDRGQALPKHYRSWLAVWQFGGDLTLVGLPGEAVSEYVPPLQKALGKDRLWTAGYCHESFGYLPTARILREGGHESMCLTLDHGFFAPEVEEYVVSQARQLAEKAGRKAPGP